MSLMGNVKVPPYRKNKKLYKLYFIETIEPKE